MKVVVYISHFLSLPLLYCRESAIHMFAKHRQAMQTFQANNYSMILTLKLLLQYALHAAEIVLMHLHY